MARLDSRSVRQTPPLQKHDCTKPAIFSLHGRIDAWRFLAYFIVYTLLYVSLIIVSAWVFVPLLSSRPDLNITSLPIIILLLLYSLSFLPQHIPARRRLYDLGKDGKWSLLLLLPVVNIFFVLYLLFSKGDSIKNKYGEVPCQSSLFLKLFCLITPILIGVAIKIMIGLWQSAI